jgi:hypothetical protein
LTKVFFHAEGAQFWDFYNQSEPENAQKSESISVSTSATYCFSDTCKKALKKVQIITTHTGFFRYMKWLENL